MKTLNIMHTLHLSFRRASFLFIPTAITLLGLTITSCSSDDDFSPQRMDTEEHSALNTGVALNNFEANVLEASVQPFTRSAASDLPHVNVDLSPFATSEGDGSLKCDVSWGSSNITRASDTGYTLQWGNIGTATQIAIQPRSYAATSYSTYTVSTAGTISATTPYYFETANSDVITSWYPYNSGSLASFTVQTNQSTLANYIASDLVFASQTVSTTSQSLAYSHKMSQLIVDVTVSNANYLTNSEIQSLTIAGLKTTCSPGFTNSGNTVASPSFAASGSTTATISAYRYLNSSNSTTSTATFIMCVPAQTIATTQVFTIVVGGTTYTGKLANAQNLVSGSAHNISIDCSLPVPVIDMGTADGLLWTVWNVGASLPADYGNYYEWGATAPYPTGANSNTTWSESNKWAWLDYTGTLPLSNDIANITYGGKYRTPTKEEFDNLITKCNWNGNTYKTNSSSQSIKGYTATSKANGNQIFIPMGGIYEAGSTNKTAVGTISYLWSATSLIYNNSYKDAWDFNNATMYSNYIRAKALPIRAVYDTNM